MTIVAYWKGVGVASAAAGPLFLLAALATTTPDLLAEPNSWPLGLFVGFASLPVGFVLALIPNWFGAALLGALGCGNDAARLPVFWALIGAGIGGALDAAVAASGTTPGFTPMFTLTALASALICRWGTRWTDQGA